MLGSLLVSVLGFVAIALLSANTIGNDFQGATTFLADKGVLNLADAHGALDPNIAVLSALATRSVFLRVMIFVGFAGWIWFWIPGMILYAQRCVLAWSLDRAAPAFLGKLHDRYGTPHIATIAVTAIGVVFLGLIIWTEFFATLVFILAAAVVWGACLLLGAFFPFVRRRLFDQTSLGRLGHKGQLLMSFGCGAGACAMFVVGLLLFRDPLAAGNLTQGLATVGGTFAIGIGVFFLQARRLKHSGLDLKRAYEEIPIE